MQHEATMLQLDALTIEDNVRLPNRYNLVPLANDIAQRDLITPILVWKNPAGKHVVLQGHRRTAAVRWLKENNRKVFDNRFKAGVRVIIVSGITEAEAMEIKVDHGNEQSLADPYELQMCANLLFRAGLTEEAVAIDLCGLMDRLKPMKANVKKKLDEYRANLSTAKAEKDTQKAGELEALITKTIAEYRRGMVQGLHNTYRCPEIVHAALYKEAAGETPKGYEKVPLPRLTDAMVTSLWQAHKKDMEATGADGLPKFSKRQPGPAFREKWATLLEAEAKAAASMEVEAPRAKSKSAKDLLAALEEGTFSSPLAHAMLQFSLGKDVPGLHDLDLNAHFAELVAKHDPKEWANFLKGAKTLEAEVVGLEAKAKPLKGREPFNTEPTKGSEEVSDGVPVPTK